jgi:hypothetical protein
MSKRISFQNAAALLVLALGLTRMAGYLLDNRVLQGIGAASGVAPFTKVFCSADGYEAFTADYWLYGQRADGSKEKLKLTPELYAKIQGPYMRRNVYGAALVFAPRLPEQLRQCLHDTALQPNSTMWQELALPKDWISASIHIQDREGQEWDFSASKQP